MEVEKRNKEIFETHTKIAEMYFKGMKISDPTVKDAVRKLKKTPYSKMNHRSG